MSGCYTLTVTADDYPLVAEMMMIRRMTATTTPMIAIIFMFCHQYFLFRRVACSKSQEAIKTGSTTNNSTTFNWEYIP